MDPHRNLIDLDKEVKEEEELEEEEGREENSEDEQSQISTHEERGNGARRGLRDRNYLRRPPKYQVYHLGEVRGGAIHTQQRKAVLPMPPDG